MRLRRASFVLLLSTSCALLADPGTKRLEVDFSRQVQSRNLNGLATRADGRLVAGPVVSNLESAADLPQLLWSLVPAGENRWLAGTGPDGKILEVELDGKKAKTKVLADLDAAQVFAVLPTSDGKRVLAGTSTGGGLYALDKGKIVARVGLPADSIFDLQWLDAKTALAATGNPGRIYKINLAKLLEAGVQDGKASEAALEKAGISLFGEIRDRNVRRLLVVSPTRVLAGSSPQSALYEFSGSGSAPFIVHDPADSEITDLLAAPDGAIYIAIVYGTSGLSSRASAPVPAAAAATTSTTRAPSGPGGDAPPAEAAPAAAAPPHPPPPAGLTPPKNDYAGRSEVVRLTAQGFIEPVVSRSGVAVYRLALQGHTLLMAAGENGEVLGYDLTQRSFLTFAGTDAAQTTALARIDDGRWLVLKNNFAGFATLDFTAAGGARTVETQKLDLGQPATLGSLRFARHRAVESSQLELQYRFSNSSEEAEGWTPWKSATRDEDSFRFAEARGRYVKLKLTVAPGAGRDFELGKAALYAAPQNFPPQIQDFRSLPPNLGLTPAAESRSTPTLSLNQLLFPGQRASRARDDDDAPSRSAFLGSQVYPQPGNQLVYWNISDAEGDNLLATLELRPQAGGDWTTLAAGLHSPYWAFATDGLTDGAYVLRLTVTEDAPRAEADRLTSRAEVDDLLIDRTPPAISEAAVVRTSSGLRFSVKAKDALTLLRGAEVTLNNGNGADQITPADSVLDGREESFVIDLPASLTLGATHAEIVVTDAFGNRAARRVALP